MADWNDLIRDVGSHLKRLDLEGCDIPLFRGHSDASWKLESGLGRLLRAGRDRKIESIFYYDFVSSAGNLISDSVNSWDSLFLMQHHGMPTRLLDWSSSFSVALYFALKPYIFGNKNIENQDCCVWILNPFALNSGEQKSQDDSCIYNPNSDFSGTYFECFITEDKNINDCIDGYTKNDFIAINPTKSFSRMSIQKSYFTLHVDGSACIDVDRPDSVKKFIINKNMYSDAINFLRLAGVNEYSVFPDLDGLARFLCLSHR